MLPIQQPSDYSNLIKDSVLQMKRVVPWDRTCNSLNKKIFYTDNLPTNGMLYDCVIVGKVRKIWSDGTYVNYGDQGGLDSDFITLSDSLKTTVEWVKVMLNDWEIINHTNMQ